MRHNLAAKLVPFALMTAALLTSGCTPSTGQAVPAPTTSATNATPAPRPATNPTTAGNSGLVTKTSPAGPPKATSVKPPAPARGSEVEAAISLQFYDDGTVGWIDAKMVNTNGQPTVVPVGDGARRTAPFAPTVELLTPLGCTEPYSDVNVDANGLGQTPCTWETFKNYPHFAVKIWLGPDGRITKMADRYHP